MELHLFLQAIFTDTVALVSSGGSVVLLILSVTIFFNKPTPRWIVLLVAAVCFVFAAARVWTTEHRKAIDLQSKLERLTIPQLILTVDELGVGEMQLGTTPRRPGVFVIANLINKGAPSIAENWLMRIVLTDGRSVDAPAIYLNPEEKITGRENVVGGTWKMSMADALYAKASKPIQQGDKVRGLLIFTAPNFTSDELRKAGVKYILQCTDINGTKAEFVLTFTGKPEEHRYFPGMSPIPH